MRNLPFILLSVIIFVNPGPSSIAQTSPQSTPSEYSIVNRFSLPGDEFWDCITADETLGRLFIAHGSMVQVIDEKGNLIGTIANTKSVHEIAVASGLNTGYISDGKDSTVTVFNYKTLVTQKKIKIPGQYPDAIIYEPVTKTVYVFNTGSATAAVIDTKTNKVIDIIVLDGKPESAVTDGKGNVYVNILDRSFVRVINAKTRKIAAEWLTSPGLGPTGIAIDPENNRLFSACLNEQMVILDTKTGKIISTQPIGKKAGGVVYDTQKKLIFTSNGEGTITVIQVLDNYTYKILKNITSQKGAKTIALDKKTHHLFLPVAEYNPAPEGQKPTIKPNSFVVLDIEPH